MLTLGSLGEGVFEMPSHSVDTQCHVSGLDQGAKEGT
jgi:hypothetical protein